MRAARAIGTPRWRIMLRHVLPNSFGPVIVMATLQAGSVVVETAGLSFLGLGAQPPSPDWGALLADGHNYFLTAWWIATFPGLAIFCVVLGFNLIGDALRDQFDPRRRDMNGGGLLEVEGLTVTFPTEAGTVTAVDDLSFTIDRGETLVIVGESGSGKSVTSLAVMGLIAPPGRVAAKAIRSRAKDGIVRDLSRLAETKMRLIRGAEIAMIFQEPMTSLNPVYTIGEQIIEAIRFHETMSRRAARGRAEEMLKLLGIPEPRRRLDAYPHQLSGGMRQRAMIGMALSCRPSLLIADEPTTALDVTVQAQILELMRGLQKEFGMAVIFITHNLGVAAEIADRIMVMYAGQAVETGSGAGDLSRHRACPTRSGSCARCLGSASTATAGLCRRSPETCPICGACRRAAASIRAAPISSPASATRSCRRSKLAEKVTVVRCLRWREVQA